MMTIFRKGLSFLADAGRPADAAPDSAPGAIAQAIDARLDDASERLESFWQPLQDFIALLRDWFLDQRFNLVVFCTVLAASFVLAMAVSWLIRNVFIRLAEKTRTDLDQKTLGALHAPVIALLVASGVMCSIAVLKMPAALAAGIRQVYYAAATLSIVWGLLRTVGVFNDHFKAIADRTDGTFDNLLIDLLRRVVKVAIWIIALLFIAQNIFRLNVSAMLAGAGVAGLAIAFAAQNTIANIFGAVTLILDKPFSIGERIQAGGRDGIVEGVGLRSTRIRSLDGTLWTVPNRELADSAIENLSRRPNFKQVFDIGLVYSTTPEQMRRAVEILHEVLDGNALFDMDKQPPIIRFTALKDWSLNITAIVWFQTLDWGRMLAEKEAINLAILARFNAEGLEFAFPSSTTYLAGDAARPVEVRK